MRKHIEQYRPMYIIMTGLPASGKTSVAKELVKLFETEGITASICSTDIIAKDLFGDEYNGMISKVDENIFMKEMFSDVREHLLEGRNVILDGDNLTIEERKQALDAVKHIPCAKMSYIISKKFSDCVKDDSERTRSVGKEYIAKCVRKFEMPLNGEGFDYITMHIEEELKSFSQKKREMIKQDMMNFDQCNPKYTHTLGEHSKLMEEEFASENLFWTELATWHDVGKLFTQSFDKNGVAHYPNYENVGAYFMLSNYNINMYDIADGDSQLFFLALIQSINYHTIFDKSISLRYHRKWKKLLGRTYDNLAEFHAVDKMHD